MARVDDLVAGVAAAAPAGHDRHDLAGTTPFRDRLRGCFQRRRLRVGGSGLSDPSAGGQTVHAGASRRQPSRLRRCAPASRSTSSAVGTMRDRTVSLSSRRDAPVSRRPGAAAESDRSRRVSVQASRSAATASRLDQGLSPHLQPGPCRRRARASRPGVSGSPPEHDRSGQGGRNARRDEACRGGCRPLGSDRFRGTCAEERRGPQAVAGRRLSQHGERRQRPGDRARSNGVRSAGRDH